MRDDRLSELLSALPEEQEIANRAARARQRALARFELPVRVGLRRPWVPLVPAAVLLIIAALILGWFNRFRRIEPLVWTPPPPQIAAAPLFAPVREPLKPVVRRPPRLKQQRMELYLVLSNGMRVQWTLDEKFNL